MKIPFLHVLAGMTFTAAALCSCDVENTAEDAAPRLKVDKAIVQVIQTGKLKDGSVPTVDLIANKGYQVSSDQNWLAVDKPEGTGRVSLQILAQPNESGSSREGHLTVTSLDRTATVTVRQSLEQDTDDGLPIGTIYFSDDFAWCVGGSDDVGNQTIGDARNIYTWNYEANGFTSSLPFFQERYDDLNPNAKTVYTMDGYIKFDKTNTITAIAVKNLGIEPGKTTSVKVSFRCARYNSDKTNVVVGLEGDGKLVGGTTEGKRQISEILPMSSDKLTWSDVSVDLSGISSNSKIIIGETTFVKDGVNDKGTFRWYMDDLKIEKIQ